MRRLVPRKLLTDGLSKLTKKRSVYVTTVTDGIVTLPAAGWSGGSITTWSVVKLSTLNPPEELPKIIPPTDWPTFRQGSVDLPFGQAVLIGGIFRGNPSHLTIVVNLKDLASLFRDFHDTTPPTDVEDWLLEEGVK